MLIKEQETKSICGLDTGDVWVNSIHLSPLLQQYYDYKRIHCDRLDLTYPSHEDKECNEEINNSDQSESDNFLPKKSLSIDLLRSWSCGGETFTCCGNVFGYYYDLQIHINSRHRNRNVAENTYMYDYAAFPAKGGMVGVLDDVENNSDCIFEHTQEVDIDSNITSAENTPIGGKKGVKKFRCIHKDCDNLYTSKKGLQYHLAHGHSTSKVLEKPFKCKFEGCRKQYKNSNGLQYHLSKNH